MSVTPLGSKGTQPIILSKSRSQATIADLASTTLVTLAKMKTNTIPRLSTTQVPNRAAIGSPLSRSTEEASRTVSLRSGAARKTIPVTNRTFISIKMSLRATMNIGVINKLKLVHSDSKKSRSKSWNVLSDFLSRVMCKRARFKPRRNQACNGSASKRGRTQFL